jgi:hypothetical protein
MMGQPYESAREVRDHNTELDEQLLALFDAVPADRIHENFGDEWTVAHNLAHIAEFPAYFARQLHQWIDGERVVIGRVAEHDADRNDAVFRAPSRGFDELREQAETSFTALRDALESLEDHHLDEMTQNVKYGAEPFTAFLDRYVVGHKAAHVEQLRDALERLAR